MNFLTLFSISYSFAAIGQVQIITLLNNDFYVILCFQIEQMLQVSHLFKNFAALYTLAIYGAFVKKIKENIFLNFCCSSCQVLNCCL